MNGTIKYFYDSWAIISYIRGENEEIKKYFLEEKGITTKLCLMEVYYILIKNLSKEEVDNLYNSLLKDCIEITDEDIKSAMELRFEINEKLKGKRHISYPDAVGYYIAKKYDLFFLTHDSSLTDYEKLEKEKNKNFKEIIIDLGKI